MVMHCYQDWCKIPTYIVDVTGPNNRADWIFHMCISTGTADISNSFQYPQWNFPTLSNINIGIFLYISLHRVEFSNILQHIYSREFCFRCLLFPITQQPKQNHDLETVPVQYLIDNMLLTIKFVTILCIIQDKINDTGSFFLPQNSNFMKEYAQPEYAYC
jgi:hypothetical protein